MSESVWMPEPARGAPVQPVITYQGRLVDNGVPADGAFDMQFELFDDAAAGVQVGVTVDQVVTVTDGLFTVELDFQTAYTDTQLWLAIGVRPNGDANPHITLTPRQKLTAAPLAQFALSGGSGSGDGHSLDAADGNPVDALFVDNDGKVGIGTTTPQTPLAISIGANPVGITQGNVGGGSTMELTTSDTNGNQATRILLRGGFFPTPDIEFYTGDQGIESQTMKIVGATGNLNVTGDVVASGFVGDGSGLTGLPGTGDAHSLDAADGTPADAVFVDNDGKVGIGTSAPLEKLHVAEGSVWVGRGTLTTGQTATLSLSGARTGSANRYAGIDFFNFEDGAPFDYLGAQISSHNDAPVASGDLRFLTKSTGDPVPVRRMTIASTGEVGIGTNAPTTALEVAGTVSATAFAGDGSGLTGVGDGHSLDAADGAPADAVFVDNTGNVGIGTSTPAELLHAVGVNPTIAVQNTTSGATALNLTNVDRNT